MVQKHHFIACQVELIKEDLLASFTLILPTSRLGSSRTVIDVSYRITHKIFNKTNF